METIENLVENLPHLAYVVERYPSPQKIYDGMLDGSTPSDVRRDLIVAYSRITPPKVAAQGLMQLLAMAKGQRQNNEIIEVALEKLSLLVTLDNKGAISAVLLPFTESQQDDTIREAAIYALRFALTAPAIGLLLSVAQDHSESNSMRGLALESLSMAEPDADIEKTITRLLVATEPEVAFWAAHALGTIGSPASAGTLETVREGILVNGPSNSAETSLLEEIEDAISLLKFRHAPE